MYGKHLHQNKRRRRYINYVSIKSTDPTRKESSGECIGGAATYVRYIYHTHISHVLMVIANIIYAHMSHVPIATVTMVYVHMRNVLVATVTIIHVNPIIEGLSCSYLHDRSFEKYIIITIMIMFDMLTANLKTANIVSMVVCSGVVVSNVFRVDAICVVVRSMSIGNTLDAVVRSTSMWITCMKPF